MQSELENTCDWIIEQMKEDVRSLPHVEWRDRFESYMIANIRPHLCREAGLAGVGVSVPAHGVSETILRGESKEIARVPRLLDSEYPEVAIMLMDTYLLLIRTLLKMEATCRSLALRHSNWNADELPNGNTVIKHPMTNRRAAFPTRLQAGE